MRQVLCFREESATASEKRFVAAAHAALAGTFGAQSVLFAKSRAEVVRTTYFMLLGLVFCVSLQLKLFNTALEKEVCPVRVLKFHPV